ncbi:type II toxin-antitoxin system RelE/ParE family toxin [Celeribacter halophilus]|uniref:type II toxin-antitoxin system RelE/ParE family toxin n=1 Tax=Celeribacter halophilus TaxID=576117 RepID=UPI001C091B6C|nr:type II toxin-antitoxin system RelE/ParE family toxin [Celeribacter halophilus]MBU2888144.1 type II toxin-antitoxin system RelE/ParE family toxin [Celeribacter halophilus]MDO6512111.1 type II toxin-antitoxin system RelE/ParE family toxin [Celeribacter halophilus]
MWDLEFTAEAEWDFELIFDHLASSYVELGDETDAALIRAASRIRGIRTSVNVLTQSPHMGTLRSDIHAGLRFVRMEKTAIWFLLDEERTCVVVVALFFGAQDHIRHMLARMLAGKT